ncbi:hypothetical protein [Pseudoalteromonas sp. T1lg48]|uniref:hypothetical protein n=1 Tax=Pseudoalteromonas sp. T1lg48 TaxID=2077100 RepID=UPI000CF60044|nr:hypothetical protein [Pseudoalteromonas sp. T1lg48]
MDTTEKKVLFTATDAQGNERSGYVDANTNSEAMQKLEENGFTDILLHYDAINCAHRDDLDGLNEQELERIANIELKSMTGMSSGALFAQALKQNWLFISFGLLGCAWGVYDRSAFFFVLGGIVALIAPVISLKNLITLSQYNKLQEADAFGEYEHALSLIKKLKPKLKAPEMAFDLDVRHASIMAKKGDIEGAFDLLAPWQQEFEAMSPGMYESRAAVIYYISGDFESLLGMMRDAYAKSDNNQTILLDLILMEARYGDVNNAQELMSNIELHLLPPIYLPFLDWIEGLIASRNNDPSASKSLSSAVSQMLEYGDNPITLTMLALMTGSYARELLRAGDDEGAKKVLQKIWPVLKENGDQQTLKELSPLMEG